MWMLLLTPLACTTTAPEAPPAPVPAPRTTESLRRHMKGHFASALDAVWLLAVGDMEQARAKAKGLQHPAHDELPEELMPHAAAFTAAAEAMTMESVEAGARQSVALAARCAACHQQADAIPQLTEQDMAVPAPGEADHTLAPYYLWVAQVAPSDVAWATGVARISAIPERPGIEPMLASLRPLAERAASAVGDARGEVWVDLLQTCQPCHQAADVLFTTD